MPWLMMDTRLPNPYYREQYERWNLNEEHPTLVILDHEGVIRYRASGDGGVGPEDINYRFAFDLIGELLQEAQADAAPQPGWEVGAQALDFQLPDLNGQTHALADYRGKTVLLTFWGTGCVECGDLVPGRYAQEVRADYGNPSELVVLGVDHHTPRDFLRNFVEEFEIDYPVLLDDKGGVFAAYRVLDEFLFVVVDPEGVVRYRGPELSDQVYGTLNELLGVEAQG